MLGITRRGLLREVTNINIDEEIDGPSEHVRHIQHHRGLVEPAVREFLQRALADDAPSGLLAPVDDLGAMDNKWAWRAQL